MYAVYPYFLHCRARTYTVWNGANYLIIVHISLCVGECRLLSYLSSPSRISVIASRRSVNAWASSLTSADLRAPLTVRIPTAADSPLMMVCVTCTPALPSSVEMAKARLMMLDCVRRIAMIRPFIFCAQGACGVGVETISTLNFYIYYLIKMTYNQIKTQSPMISSTYVFNLFPLP